MERKTKGGRHWKGKRSVRTVSTAWERERRETRHGEQGEVGGEKRHLPVGQTVLQRLHEQVKRTACQTRGENEVGHAGKQGTVARNQRKTRVERGERRDLEVRGRVGRYVMSGSWNSFMVPGTSACMERRVSMNEENEQWAFLQVSRRDDEYTFGNCSGSEKQEGIRRDELGM